MMRHPKWANCRMASHPTDGWKNYVDTYALRFGAQSVLHGSHAERGNHEGLNKAVF
jgi:hypothetical protein